MLSRLLTNSLMGLKYLTKTSLFFCSDVGFRADKNINKQVLKLQSLNSFQQINRYLNQNKEMTESDLKQLLNKISKMSGTPGENFSYIIQKIKAINFQKIDLQFLTTIATVIQNLAAEHESFEHTIIQKIDQRIQKSLAQPSSFSQYQLIRFLEVLRRGRNFKSRSKLLLVLKQRITNLKYKDYRIYVDLVDKVKFPTKWQKQIFNQFAKKMERDIQRIDIRTTINMYKAFKNINRNVYNYGNILDLLEKRIKNSFDELDEKDIFNLVDLSSHNNYFLKIVYSKIMESIDDNGQSLLPADTIFKLLLRITISEQFRLVGQNQNKFMKFIEKNLSIYNHILILIKRGFFTRKQILTLNKMIHDNKATNYLNSIVYLNELATKGITELQHYKNFLQKLKQQNDIPNILGEKLILTMNILDRIHSGIDKDSSHSQYKEINNNYIKAVENIKEEKLIRNPYNLRKNKTIEVFNRKYGHLFVNSLIQNTLKQKKKLSNAFFNYLIIANDQRSIAKICKENINSISMYGIKSLLEKVIKHPYTYKGNFGTINRLLLEFEDNKQTINQITLSYLCNWQIHQLLNSQQVQGFLRLALKTPSKCIYSATKLFQYSSYFFNSPSNILKSHQKFKHFVEEMQNIKLYQNKKKTEGQAVQEDKNKNEKVLIQNLALPYIGIEAMRMNVLSPQYIAKLDKKNINEKGILKYYISIQNGQKFNKEETKINPYNLVLITKCKNMTEEQLTQMFPQIKAAISQSRISQCQSAILNFQMRYNKKSSQILKDLIARYTKFINSGKESLKLQIVIEYLNELNQFYPEYKELLAASQEYFMRYFQKISILSHGNLIIACTNANIDCQRYLERLFQKLQSKINKYEFDSSSLHSSLPYFLSQSPLQTLKIYKNLQRQRFNLNLLDRLIKNLWCVDPKDQKVFKELKPILEFAKIPQQIPEGLFHYLSTQNPNYKELKDKLKIVPFTLNYDLVDSIPKYLDNNNIKYQVLEKFGHKGLKIGEKYLFFIRLPYNTLINNTMIKYFGTIFEIPDYQNKIIVTFTSGLSIPRYISKLCFQFPQLKQKKLEFINFIRNNRKKIQEQPKQNKQHNLPQQNNSKQAKEGSKQI